MRVDLVALRGRERALALQDDVRDRIEVVNTKFMIRREANPSSLLDALEERPVVPHDPVLAVGVANQDLRVTDVESGGRHRGKGADRKVEEVLDVEREEELLLREPACGRESTTDNESWTSSG